jgi:hypothetical protein
VADGLIEMATRGLAARPSETLVANIHKY